MNDKVREDVALFRFSLIAPIITKTLTQPTLIAYLEEICARTYDVPYYGAKSYALKTVKSWLHEYKKHGIEGLFPKRRSDKGSSWVLTQKLKNFIIDAKIKKPKRSAKSIYQELLAKRLITYESVSLPTVQRFIQSKRLSASKLTGNAKPIDRFMEDIDLLKYVPNQQELDFIFLHRVQRKVRKDATISLNREQFEEPQVFIGERVHVRFHPNSLQKAYLFSEDNKIIDTIYPVQKIDNSRIYRQKKTGVDFAIFNPMEMEES